MNTPVRLPDLAPRRSSGGGFTLVEIVVCMAILAIVLVGICAAMMTTSLANLELERDVLIANAITKKVEEIRAEAAKRDSANASYDPPDIVYLKYEPSTAGAYRKFSIPLPGTFDLIGDEGAEYMGFVIPHTRETWLPGGADGKDLSFLDGGSATLVTLNKDGMVAAVEASEEWYDLNGNGRKDSGALSVNTLLSLPIEVQVYRQGNRAGNLDGGFELVSSRVVLINR